MARVRVHTWDSVVQRITLNDVRDDFIQVRVNSEAKARMQKLADDLDLPLSVVIRHALKRGLPITEKELRGLA